MAGRSPWPVTLQRAATLSYTLVDEVHTLVDAEHLLGPDAAGVSGGDWGSPAAAAGSSSRLDPLRRKVAVAGLILFGTLISSLGKLAYQLPAVGRDGSVKPFEKPWFMVLLMFAGMALNLPLSLFLDLVRLSRQRVLKALAGTAGRTTAGGRTQQQQQQRDLYVPLLQYDQYDDEVPVPFEGGSLPPVLGDASGSITAAYWRHHFRRLFHRQLLLLLLPTVCDLVGAALLNIGLLSVTASATQMMRQSLLPFAALLGVGLWRKRLNGYHAAGLTGCVVGLGLVAAAALASGYGGSASLPPDSSSRGAMAAGIAMILASQFVAAGQLLIDQSSWNTRLQLSPLKIVGCEGLLGMLLTMFVVLPLADVSSLSGEGRGLSEDTWDTLVMISSRPLLQVLLLVYTGSLQAYNICGMITAGELSAVDTTLLQAVRTLLVWVTNLVVYAVAAAVTPNSTDQHHHHHPEQQQQHSQPLSVAAVRPAAAGAATAAEETLVPVGVKVQQLQHQQQRQQQQQHQADMAAGQPDALQGTSVVPEPRPAGGGVSIGGQQQQQQQQEPHAEIGAGSVRQQLASIRRVQPLPPVPPLQLQQQQQQQQWQQTLPVHLQDGSEAKRSRRSSRPSSSRVRLRAEHPAATSHSQPGAPGPLQQAFLGCCYGAAVRSAAAAAAAASAVSALTAGSVGGAAAGVQVAAAQTGALALPPAGSAAAAAAAEAAGSFHASAAAAAAAAAVSHGLPGEPWLVWSFMQAAGFALLVLAAITYSRGDNERWRRQLAAEAALIFADMPPFGGAGTGAAAAAGGGGGSRAPSVASSSVTAAAGHAYKPFTANMDIDSVAFLRSSQGAGYGGGGGRWRRGGDSLYGVTPISHSSPLRRRDSGSSLGRSVASGGVVVGSSPELDNADGVDGVMGPGEVPGVQVGQQQDEV